MCTGAGPWLYWLLLLDPFSPAQTVCVCRIAVFSITVLHDERIVVVAEQRPDSTEEDSFQWMSRVLQVERMVHFIRNTCTILLPPGLLLTGSWRCVSINCNRMF